LVHLRQWRHPEVVPIGLDPGLVRGAVGARPSRDGEVHHQVGGLASEGRSSPAAVQSNFRRVRFLPVERCCVALPGVLTFADFDDPDPRRADPFGAARS